MVNKAIYNMNPLDKYISQLPNKPRKGVVMFISKSLFTKYKYLLVNGKYAGIKVKTL